MRYLIINAIAANGGTGTVAIGICRKLMKDGHEVVFAYGRGESQFEDVKTIKIGNKLDNYWHVAMTRLFDRHGLASKRATRKFLKWVDCYKPDVIWLHNLHGYYINYEELFNYIKRNNISVRWTLHDCWSFTGHCSHFTFVKCEQWQSHCSSCPQMRAYPACILKSSAYKNFERKKEAFTNVKDLELIVPSNWLKIIVGKSFLKDYPCTVVYNEIDRSIFKPTPSTFRQDFHLEGKKIVLGVASTWSQRKGLDDFYKLATMLDDSYAIVLVGLSEKQIRKLPKKIVGLKKTSDNERLAQLYSLATVFVNPSKEETFGMTTIEAVDCGTPAIVYKDTACEEVVKTFGGGVAVDQNVYALYKAITGHVFNEKKHTGGGYLIAMTRTENPRKLVQLYSAADFFVNPTYEDNYPTVNLEATACGCFVITYDVGGCQETLEQHVICSPKDD